MSVVASAPLVNGNHEHTPNFSMEQSPSRFTAVNGREASGPAALNGASESQPTVDNHHEHRDSEEKERSTGDGQLNSRLQRDSSIVSQDPASSSVRDFDGGLLNSDRPSTGDNPYKRKRSYSAERQIPPPEANNPPRTSRSPVSKTDDDSTARPQTVDVNGSARSSTAPESETFGRSLPPKYGPMERVEAARSNLTPPTSHLNSHGQQHSSQPVDSSDAQLAEALQRDVQGPSTTTTTKPWELANRPQSESLDPQNPGHSNEPSQPPPSTETQGRPKKKRAFSNRTKTGCMTCRRRKKKCDEQHPECNNCIRGGFQCEGYTVHSAWNKPSKPQTPIPLQSKEHYPDAANAYIQDVTAQRPDVRVQPLAHTDGSRARPLSVDDSDRNNRPQYLASPNAGPTSSWSKGSWTASAPSHFVPDHSAKTEFRDGPPPMGGDLSRAEHPKNDYHLVRHVRDLSHGPHGKPGMTVFQSNMEQRPGHPAPVEVSNYPAQAHLALSTMEQPHQPQMAYEQTGKTEKVKMLDGEGYNPHDPELVLDRERCAVALKRYNQAKDPTSGISPEEITRLLKQVLMGRTDFHLDGPIRSLGPGVVVEAPFRCRYGYNIHLGEDVMISENCFFVDDCNIKVGAHTWIGPNVTILSSMASGGMLQRKGSKSNYQGSPVIIEEDCWIGPGCTILPGVTIGRGAYVAAGEVVRFSIIPYGNQGQKPMNMS
ncbi:hypothetical protein VTO42DRAFT_3386 [Malbranchea cinnamomea]